MNVAKALIWLGIIGVFIGAILLSWLLDWYMSDDLVFAVGVPGLGLFFLMKGLSKLGRRGLGIAVFVLGAAGIVAIVITAKGRRDDEERGWELHRAAAAVAEAVCDGKPNTAAITPKGARAIMQVTSRPDSESKSKFANNWEGLPAPKTVAELQLVACRVSRERTIHTCRYVSEPGDTLTSYKIYLAQQVDTITVRDAKTAAVLGEETFEGGMPPTSCSEKIETSEYYGNRTSTGDSPSREKQTAFLQTFVKPAE